MGKSHWRCLQNRASRPHYCQLVLVSQGAIRGRAELRHIRYGMVDDEGETWRSEELRPITFESRINDVMLPHMKAEGLEGRIPDLVVISSLFWDEDFILEVGRATRRT